MKTFSELLLQSQKQYRELISKTEEIGDRVHRLDSETIRAYQKELSVLLERAQVTDAQINDMAMSNLNGEAVRLFHERSEIMKKFLELNRTVASKLNDKQAVIRSEYLKVKNGRKGISGYQSSIKKPNLLINSSA
jgi:hypothetical protein